MSRLSRFAFISLLLCAQTSACAVADGESAESSEHETRIRPTHLDPNKAASLIVAPPKNAPVLVNVDLFVAGTATKLGATRWFEGPVDVEVRLCYGVNATLCSSRVMSLAPKTDATLDLGAIAVSLPPKDPPPEPPAKPDFGPKGYAAGTKVQPDWLPRLIVRAGRYGTETTKVIPVGATGLLPNVGDALGGGAPFNTTGVPVLPGKYVFASRGFDGNSGSEVQYEREVEVLPGVAERVEIRRNRYSASIARLITLSPPVRELPDAIAQRFDLVIATKNTNGIYMPSSVPSVVFPITDDNQWGKPYDPIPFPTIGQGSEKRSVFRALSLSTASTSKVLVHALRPFDPPPGYDGAYFFVVNGTQFIEVGGAVLAPKLGRVDVDDVEVTNEQTGAVQTVKGTWRLLAGRTPVYGTTQFETSHGLDVVPGTYVVEVSFVSPWTGAQKQLHPITVP